MICKQLEGKIELNPQVDTYSELSRPVYLEYYLTESYTYGSEFYTDIISEQNRVYGIEVVKKEAEFGHKNKIECEMVRNFSFCKNNTKQILNKLMDNVVTPVELPFIIDDLLGA